MIGRDETTVSPCTRWRLIDSCLGTRFSRWRAAGAPPAARPGFRSLRRAGLRLIDELSAGRSYVAIANGFADSGHISHAECSFSASGVT